LKRGKRVLPYIDIGEANTGLAIAKKEKEKGKRVPKKGKKSAHKLRQVLSTG
jgi:hypothetical protein